MTLAVQFGDNTNPNSLAGAIYFNVVTAYNKDFGGRVTEHPLEVGASITDHYISQNPKFSIVGVISHVDFANISNNFTVEGQEIINNTTEVPAVIVNDSTGLRKYVPGVVDQFFGQVPPSVTVDQTQRMNWKEFIEDLLKDIMSGLQWNETRQKWETRMMLCTIYEIVNQTAIRPTKDLVMTSVKFEEDEDSGDALYLTINFEQVTFAKSEKATAPKAEGKVKRSTDGKKDKGNKPAPVDDPKNPPKERTTVLGELEKAGR